jgi:Fungal chitosanase of glycosyl hydrolase group 75
MAISVTHEGPIPRFREEEYARTRSFWPFMQISRSPNLLCNSVVLALVLAFSAAAAHAQTSTPHSCFEVLTHRMDVDVDGAPNAYGPPGKPTLDVLIHAHYLERADQKIVGYLLDKKQRPVLQSPEDPFPGYYVSQTAFADVANHNERDPRGYVDARNINYVVRGNEAARRGVKVGDFVAVYSKKTHKAVFAIVGDTGNPTGDEGSLHLLQELGYPFHDGISGSVTRPEVVIRFYPNSNPKHQFFFTQAALDEAATKLGLSRDFSDARAPNCGR